MGQYEGAKTTTKVVISSATVTTINPTIMTTSSAQNPGPKVHPKQKHRSHGYERVVIMKKPCANIMLTYQPWVV